MSILVKSVPVTPISRSFLEYPSDMSVQIDLPAVAANTALPSVVVSGLPAGLAITKVEARLKVRAIQNLSDLGSNGFNGAQNIEIQKGAGAWIPAINIPDNQWIVASLTREAGDVLIGDIDLKATVDGDATYNFRFASALVDLASLRLNDVLVLLRFYYSTN